MNRLHALVVAVLLGIAAVAGSYAALGTTALGVTASEATVCCWWDSLVVRNPRTRIGHVRPGSMPISPSRSMRTRSSNC